MPRLPGWKARKRAAAAALALLASAGVFAACGDNGDGTEPPATSAQEGDAPEATHTVVVPSLTRADADETPEPTPTPGPAPGPPSPDSVVIEPAFPDLPTHDRPVAMVEVPGAERFLLVLQEGRVLSYADDAGASSYETVLDWQSETRRDGNEEGLLGIALSPEFESNGYVYLYYTAAGGERRSVVSRFESTGAGPGLQIDADSELVLLEVPQPYPNHNGGDIHFGPDGMLYIALGDGGSAGDPEGNGQDPGTLLGSILRIDVSGASQGEPYVVPPDNPFVDDSGARDEIFAFGFRNPWRFSFDRETGELWAGDVGQNAYEEIDLVQSGGNYGWNIMEGFSCYQADSCDQEGLALPVVDYARQGPHCSVTGGYVARGPGAGTLEGWYVYADFCSGATWAVPAAEADAQPEAVTLRDSGPQTAAFAEALDGRLYMLGFDGTIYRITG
ncbi:MAG: PQQ-dependent sugar dehydrogenase [Dehalococcoidia bacterium]|nr:PQQ-dependent sugar dehydrogenase [Dehalococcoidia bacterium]